MILKPFLVPFLKISSERLGIRYRPIAFICKIQLCISLLSALNSTNFSFKIYPKVRMKGWEKDMENTNNYGWYRQ